MPQHPLRVLVVVNSLVLGGAERVLERMVLRLHETGEVHYLVCSLEEEGPIGRRLRSRGVEVVPLGARGGAAGAVLRGIRGVRRILREGGFDLVHSFLHRSHFAARVAGLGLERRVPLVSAEHGVNDNRSWASRRLNSEMSRLSDRVLVVSEAIRDRVIRRDGIPAGKVRVVHNGVETASPNPAARRRVRRALGIPRDDVVFLALGRLHREKGPDLLLEALARLRGLHPGGWDALMVGEGEEGPRLREHSERLGLGGRVFFAGARRNVAPWIEASDVLVLPSREEGLPVAPLEAMARGKAVVATRVGGTPEVVRDGETGILVPPEDPAALAEALSALLRDADRRSALGERGRERVRADFSLERMTSEILALYRETLEEAVKPERTTRREVL